MPTNRAKEAAKILDEFCRWLENKSYLDDDWWRENPKAVDTFLSENKSLTNAITKAEREGYERAIEDASKVADENSYCCTECTQTKSSCAVKEIANEIRKLKGA